MRHSFQFIIDRLIVTKLKHENETPSFIRTSRFRLILIFFQSKEMFESDSDALNATLTLLTHREETKEIE